MKTLPMHWVCNFIMLFMVVSCGSNVDYDFIVRDLNEVGEKKIDFKFKEIKGARKILHTYSVDFSRTQRLSINPRLTFSGLVSWGDYNTFFYPDLGSISSSGNIEIFFYKPITIIERDENIFKLYPMAKTTAYFIHFIKNEKVLTVISKDNVLNISTPRENLEFSKILSSEFDDLTIFDRYEQPMLEGLKEHGGFRGGYITKSSIDGTLIWLQ